MDIKKIWFDKDYIYGKDEEGRTLRQSLLWYPRLAMASDKERESYQIGFDGIHWSNLDEDISFESFGYYPAEGENESDMARRHLDIFLKAIEGEGMAPSARVAGKYAPVQPQSPGLRERIWWGAGTDSTAVWTAQKGLNLMSSTLMLEDRGIPFDQQQAQQIRLFRSEWVKAGNSGVPRVSVSRSVLPVIDETSARYFGRRAAEDSQDYTGIIDNSFSRFGRSYIGDPADIAEELARDEAVQAADTVLLTIPNQLGVDFNLKMLEAIVKEVKPALTTK